MNYKNMSRLFSLIAILCSVSFYANAGLELQGQSGNLIPGGEYEYDINYDTYSELTYRVTGGEIIRVQWYDPNNVKEGFSASNGSGILLEEGKVVMQLSADKKSVSFFPTFDNQKFRLNQKAPKITVKWDNTSFNGSLEMKARNLGFLSLGSIIDWVNDGDGERKIEVYKCSLLPAISIEGFGNPRCDLQAWGSLNGGYYEQQYTWYANGAHIASQWGTGVYVDYFTSNQTATFTVVGTGKCAQSTTKTISLVDANPGPLVNNTTGGNVAVEGVKLDCEGNADLRLPYFNNNATYTWSYNSIRYNREYELLKGKGKNSYRGGEFSDEQGDVQGKVTVTGVCGTHEIPFTIPAAQSPRLSDNIIICSNTARVEAFLPNNNKVYSWWVTTGNANVVNQSSNAATIEYTNPYSKNKEAEVCAAVECGGTLCTKVIFGSGSAEGIQVGQLSDAQIPVTSQIAYAPGQKIYFTSTDGDIYYYQFVEGLEKWVLNKTGWTNQANTDNATLSPLAYSYADGVVFYWGSNNKLLKSGNTVGTDISGVNQTPIKLVVTNYPNNTLNRGVLFVLEPTGDLKIVNRNATSATLLDVVSPITIAATDNYGVFYFKNNNLELRDFDGAVHAVLANANPKANTSLEVKGDYVFYTENSGIIRRVNILTGAYEAINNGTVADGEFVVGSTVDEVFYTCRDSYLTFHTAKRVNTIWTTVKTTNSSYDNIKGSLVYQSPHIYFVSNNEWGAQGVWNTYYVPGCENGIPSARKGVVTTTEIGVEVFPNPVSGVFTITSPDVAIQSIELVDMQGVVVKSYAAATSYTVDDVQAGTYLVKITLVDGTMTVQSIIVQ